MTIQNYAAFGSLCLLLASPALVRAQDKDKDKLPVKFGKVTPQDFAVNADGIDSSAGAVIVADFGTSSFEGNSNGGFTLIFHHSRRIRILKRIGFDAANVEIPLYLSSDGAERVSSLKASTYTLEDGKIVETRLDSKSVFLDKISKKLVMEKFTFPALKEGAILEYNYTQMSPFFFNLQPWAFQGAYPCLWSEYQVNLPDFFKFVTLAQGYVPFKVNSTETHTESFYVTEPGGSGRDDHASFSDNVVMHRWVMANVPAFKEEPYTTTIDNYISKIEFQLSGIQFPQGIYKDMMGSWFSLCDELLRDEDFGIDLARNNGWLDDDLKGVTRGATSDLEKAQKVYAYVRDNFTCTDRGYLYLSNPLKTIYKNRSGTEADLNLLLTAMLIHENLKADPVILSTRSHGFTHELYPLLSRFNYVISSVRIDSVRYYLDASESCLGFGKLPERCYNGAGRVVNKELPERADLNADSQTEGKVTMAIVTNNGKGGLTARVQTRPGPEECMYVRQEVKEHGQQDFLKKIQKAYTTDATVANLELDSLKQPDQPLEIAYDVQLSPDPSSDLYYFNPMLAEGYKENPFKSANRFYPVEMPFTVDETYTLTMEIPAGYVVDELPKSARVLFNTDEGFFEYLIQKDDSQIQFRSRIKLKKANFKPEDYSTLRDFYGYIVKKESEQIVFKKKKGN